MAKDRRQQILEVAQGLFLHYGFQKVTLVDIASELGVSRPTVYQVFPNKEEIFKGILEAWQAEALVRIETSRRPEASVREQMEDAIDIWTIEPHKVVHASPKGEELFDCSYGFAKEVMDDGYVKFAELVRVILDEGEVKGVLSNDRLANFISVSLRGFKTQTKDIGVLNQLVDDLLTTVLA